MSDASRQPVSVLCLWQPGVDLLAYLQAGLSGWPVQFICPPEGEEWSGAGEAALLPLAAEADVLLGWRPTRALIDAAPKLRAVINPGAGVQHLIAMFAEIQRERDIALINGHGNAVFTAQTTVTLLLSMLSGTVPHHNAMLVGQWRLGDEFRASVPIAGRSIGLLGYGHVNRTVHRMLSGFGCKVLACNRSGEQPVGNMNKPERIFPIAALDEFLQAVDVLVIAVPFTPDSEGLIGLREIELLGRDSFLVNVARGGVVNEDALFDALQGGVLAGAAIDVWYDYRPEPDGEDRLFPWNRPFHELGNVVLSPHRAASPFDDLERWNEVIENLKRFSADSDDLLNVVDCERGY
jgi:phosphoglycerate dehydrogenase-like enzyme